MLDQEQAGPAVGPQSLASLSFTRPVQQFYVHTKESTVASFLKCFWPVSVVPKRCLLPGTGTPESSPGFERLDRERGEDQSPTGPGGVAVGHPPSASHLSIMGLDIS